MVLIKQRLDVILPWEPKSEGKSAGAALQRVVRENKDAPHAVVWAVLHLVWAQHVVGATVTFMLLARGRMHEFSHGSRFSFNTILIRINERGIPCAVKRGASEGGRR